jgi:hypothetical protein
MRIASAVSVVVFWAPHILVVTYGDEISQGSQLACVNQKDDSETRLKYRWSYWSNRMWRNLASSLVHDRAFSLSRSKPSISPGNRVIRTGSSGNIELHVYSSGDDTNSEAIAVYELLTPIELELGGKAQHVNDYAYSPVVTVETQPINVANDASSRDLEENTMLHHSWWQWWIPWKTLRDRSAKFNFFKYKMNEKAFAGGSHGEIWRGRRKCLSEQSSREDTPCSDDLLIFKRLKVENGFRTLEAGLREVYFGQLLERIPHEPREVFTRCIDHFFGEDGELWIVFDDSGISLRSLLYTAIDAGGFVVLQQSYLWTLMRMSLHSKQTESSCNSTVDEHSLATLRGTQIDEVRKIGDRTWKRLMKALLHQVRNVRVNVRSQASFSCFHC